MRLFSVLSVVALVLASSALPAKSDEMSKGELQPGYYIYLGMQPGRSLPKGFTINSAGIVNWQDVNKITDDMASLDPPARSSARSGSRQAAVSQVLPAGGQYEQYNYPIIKWKAKPVSGIPGAIVQLSTTYEVSELKYKLTLYKAPTSTQVKPAAGGQGIQESSTAIEIPYRVSVQLLDQNGFKLTEFSISKQEWEQIPGTNVLEAREKMNCNEWDYRRARDYSVK